MTHPPAKPSTTPLNALVIDSPKTASDLLIMAMKGDMQVLASAVKCKPGEVFTLQLNFQIHFLQADVQTALKDAGYEVRYTEGNANISNADGSALSIPTNGGGS